MFAGIVEGPDEIVAMTDTDGGRRLRIQTNLTFDDLHHGQSIAALGVCPIVEAPGDDWFKVFLAAKTIEKTYLGDAIKGDRVNLERALAADDRSDGHIVQDHVDGTTTVTNVGRVGDDWFFKFDLPELLASYVVQKGSVCLDGIGFTVVGRREDTPVVATVPTTYDLTTLSEKAVNDPIHAEVDVVAKYVESMLNDYAKQLIIE